LVLLGILSCIHIYPAYSVEKASSEKADVLRVGVIPFDPFVIAAKDENKGISIELWEEIVRLNNWKYEYDFLPESGYKEIEPLLNDNKLDVIIGPIAISYRRLEDISYSIPYYITTSNVITKDTNTSFGSLLLHFVKRVFRLPLFLLLLTVLICSFLIWLKERKNFPERFPQSFKHGIPYSIWYGFKTLMPGY
jgi:polar amino acid transport system substrate-binding protein